MKNTRIEHPEDTILNGDLSVLNWFLEPGHLSVKIDGCPAIVWGTDPATGTFFCGTKSVFNKVKIKIPHSHDEIDALYCGEIADILHICYDCLPRTNTIYQGDIIGISGGNNTYRPNTVTYKFPEKITQNLIITPHTRYVSKDDLRNAVSYPVLVQMRNTTHVKFVQPDSYIFANQNSFSDVEEVVAFSRQMATTVRFSDSTKQIEKIKKSLNQCIREKREIDENEIAAIADCDSNLISFWKLIKSIKEDCLYLCRNNGPEAYLGSDRIDAEGYVYTNSYGTYKLVNREVFSFHNFNYGKFSNVKKM